MDRFLRVILGAITATMLLSTIAYTMGWPIIDWVVAEASPLDAQAHPTPETVGDIQALHEPDKGNQEPRTSDDEAAAGSDTGSDAPSVAKVSPTSTAPTSTSSPTSTTSTSTTSSTTSTSTTSSITRPRTTGTTSTTIPRSTTTSVAYSADVVVWPGDDVDGLVGEAPPGTVFLFKPGRYEGIRIFPKDGMVFVAERGAVLDGLDEVLNAFVGGNGAVDVTVRGFVVERYASVFQQSAIRGATGWTIEGNEVRHNRSGGIASFAGSIIRNNFVHHNGQIGVKGTGLGLVVEGNEIAHNNTAGHPWTTATAEAGGTKFIRTTDLVVRNNYVHDNDGPGLWTDGSNRNALIVGNLVEKNTGPGIFHEISYSAIITDNKVYRNGHMGIWITASSDVEVKNNEVVDNHNGGIAANQDDRGDGFYVENLWVHDNYIQMVTPTDDFQAWNGLQQQVGDDTYFTTRNNRWDHNTYRIPNGVDRPFKWMNSQQTIQQWQTYGQDPNATFMGLP